MSLTQLYICSLKLLISLVACKIDNVRHFASNVRSLILSFCDIDPSGTLHKYCLVQYSFCSGVEHVIQPHTHRNAKNTKSEYVRTWESTKDAVKNLAETNKSREVVHQVIKGLGGVDKCTTVGQMVRNRQQVKHLTRKRPIPNSNQVKNITGQSNRVNDPWYQLLIDSKRQARDGELAFVRDVRVAPDPLCVLTNRQQLRDVTRFCSDPLEFQPFTIDPTFDIGEFSVTVSTYQHLLLENKSDSKMPSFIGPVMIHHKKTKNTYSSFSGVIKSRTCSGTSL